MNARERFKQICRFERTNDPYMWSVAAWKDTYERWYSEGMPVNANGISEHLLGHQDRTGSIRPKGAIQGMTRHGELRWIVALDPMFEPKTISETDEHIVEVDFDGAIVERKRHGDATIPRYIEYPVKDKKTWDEYKKRLDPFSPGRWPAGWEMMSEDKHFEERDFPLGMNLLSLYGNPRNYMGLEGLSYAIFDNISLVEEMIEWQAYMAYEMAKRVFEKGVTLDWVWIWEDMAFNNGPLVSPSFVRKYMAPRYRKVVDLLRSHGVEALIMDCDGNIDELIPIWIDCGINATYPLECASGMDGRKVRQKFGNNIILIGNVDKRALAKGKQEIDAEIAKVKSLLEHGGYFPNVDHHIPPDVPYKNMVYFLNELRKLSAYEETRRFI
jgi:uroporphyrinogen decarboxylase